MEKAKEYLKESVKERLKYVYGSDWETMYDFYMNASKHKLDAAKSAILEIKESRFTRRRKRLLGTKSKATPDSIYQQLLNFYSEKDRLHLAIKMQGYEGERINDLIHTKINQIDFSKHELLCYNHKEKRWYSVPLKSDVEKELREFISKYKKEIEGHNGYIFFTQAIYSKHDHLSAQYVNRRIVEALENLGLEKTYAVSSNGRKMHLYTSHSNRGHAGTYVLNKTGHDYRAMQKLLDHMPGSMSSTLLYEETDENELNKIMRG